MQPSAFIPRAERDLLRGKLAAARVAAAGEGAMAAIREHIAVTFYRPARGPNELKHRVEILMRRGVGDFEPRARYKPYADGIEAAHGSAASLDQAIAKVETWFRHEQSEIARYERIGLKSRPRVGLMHLSELRLILRWIRACGLAGAFPAIFEIATTPLHERAPSLFVVSEAAE